MKNGDGELVKKRNRWSVGERKEGGGREREISRGEGALKTEEKNQCQSRQTTDGTELFAFFFIFIGHEINSIICYLKLICCKLTALNQLIANAVMLKVRMYIARRKASSLERDNSHPTIFIPWQAVESIQCIHIQTRLPASVVRYSSSIQPSTSTHP